MPKGYWISVYEKIEDMNILKKYKWINIQLFDHVAIPYYTAKSNFYLLRTEITHFIF